MLGYLSTDIICLSELTVFREQISEHIFKAKWRLLCLLSFKYFLQRAFREYHQIFPSSSWGIFSHMMCLDQSRASENIILNWRIDWQ